MKLFAPTAFALATLTALSSAELSALVASGASASSSGSGLESVDVYDAGTDDTGFNATMYDHDGANQTNHIKTAANLMGSGAKIQVCPSGDCVNGQVIMLSMSRLQEIDGSGKPFVQEAKNFNAVNATWSPFELLVINGTDALSASFVTTFKVDKNQAEPTSFNLTAVIYQANGTAMNGNQTIDVPAGALKFSVTIGKWPFKDPANRLRFGVELKATGKNSTERDPPVDAKPKGGKAKDVDRLDMGEGMYMDAPTQAVVDGVNTAINASIEPQNKKLEFVWVFPSFETDVFYDPVMGSEDPSASATTTTTTPAVSGSASTSTSASGSTSASTDGNGSLAASGSGTAASSTNGSGSSPASGSGSVASSTAGSGSVTAGANSTVTPTATTPTPTSNPTPSPTTASTHTDTKTSVASALGATVLGVLVAAAVGGTLFA